MAKKPLSIPQPTFRTSKCKKCRRKVLVAVNAPEAPDTVVLDPKLTAEGTWEVDACCDDHEPVARERPELDTPGHFGYALHACPEK